MGRHLDVHDPVTMAVYNALSVPAQRLCFEDMLQRYAYVPDVRVEVGTSSGSPRDAAAPG